MDRPIIGVLGGLTESVMPNNDILTRVATSIDYIKMVEEAGGMPIVMPVSSDLEVIERQISICHGAIFTGGMDLNPKLYGEDPHRALGQYSNRLDYYQFEFVKKALKSDMPSLGICRGFQLMNIAQGGSLYQDPSQVKDREIIQHIQVGSSCEGNHNVYIEKGSVLYEMLGDSCYVNSYHHQFIKDLGRDVIVTAVAGDDVVEGIEIKDKKFAVGVQWHPESMADCNNGMLKLFERLVELARAEMEETS